MIAEITERTVQAVCRKCGESFDCVRRVTDEGRLVGHENNLPWYCERCRRPAGGEQDQAMRGTCVRCGAEVRRNGRRGRLPLYCSRECQATTQRVRQTARRDLARERQRAKLQRIARVYGPCRVCGQTWKNPDGIKHMPTKVCPECIKTHGKHAQKVTCSECGRTAIVTTRGSKRKTCSAQCYRRRAKRRARESVERTRAQWRAEPQMTNKAPTKQTGTAAEAMWDLMCANQGWPNAIPQAASGYPFDRVALIQNVWKTVQVKTLGHGQHGNEQHRAAQLNATGRPYKPGDWDLLAAVDTTTGDIWIIPWAKVPDTRWFRVGPKWEEYRHHVLDRDGEGGLPL